MKKIFFLLALILTSFVQIADAGVVPGTIQEWGYTSSNTCNSWTSPYSPSGGSCYPSGCDTWNQWSSSACGACLLYNQIANTCTYVSGSHSTPVGCSGTGCTGTAPDYTTWPNASACWTHNGTCATWPTCRHSSFGCEDYKYWAQWVGSLSFTNYTPINNNNPTFASNGNNRHLSNDNPQSCNRWANGTNHTPPSLSWLYSCEYSNVSYYVGWSNWSCNSFGSTDNLITSYNQIGSVSRSAPSDNDASCTVEWRYATPDDAGPSITIGGTSAVFDSDADHWCNMTKYMSGTYGTTENPVLPGCTYYKNKISHTVAGTNGKPVSDPKANPDLLENLEITIDDVSGISQVVIEIGATCSATYDLATSVSSVVASTTVASGVKASFRNITLKYGATSTNGGSLPSLKTQFNKTRLDSCLTEGKNYIKVTAKDNARSNTNGTTYDPNTYILDYSTQSKFIKVDNSSAKIGLIGDASKIAESNTASGCFIGGATIDNTWKNYTISGSLKSGDPFGADVADCSQKCTVLTSSGMTCTTGANGKGQKPTGTGIIWTAPGGVEPTTGVFIGNTCDGLGPIPDTNSCDWGCASGYSYDSTTSTCVQPSNLFILFDSSSPNASGPYAARLTNDSDSHWLLKSDCTATFKYRPNSIYAFSDNLTKFFPIEKIDGTSCN